MNFRRAGIAALATGALASILSVSQAADLGKGVDYWQRSLSGLERVMVATEGKVAATLPGQGISQGILVDVDEVLEGNLVHTLNESVGTLWIGSSSTSGFVVTTDGYLITTAHGTKSLGGVLEEIKERHPDQNWHELLSTKSYRQLSEELFIFTRGSKGYTLEPFGCINEADDVAILKIPSTSPGIPLAYKAASAEPDALVQIRGMGSPYGRNTIPVNDIAKVTGTYTDSAHYRLGDVRIGWVTRSLFVTDGIAPVGISGGPISAINGPFLGVAEGGFSLDRYRPRWVKDVTGIPHDAVIDTVQQCVEVMRYLLSNTQETLRGKIINLVPAEIGNRMISYFTSRAAFESIPSLARNQSGYLVTHIGGTFPTPTVGPQ